MFGLLKLFGPSGKIGIIIGVVFGLGGGLIGVLAALLTTGPIGALASAVFVLAVFLTVFLLIRMSFGPAIQKQRLLRDGIRGQAKILSVEETGVTMQHGLYFLVKFVVEVSAPDRTPYRVATKSVISRLTMAQFQPGATVAVMIDAKNPQKVALLDQTIAS